MDTKLCSAQQQAFDALRRMLPMGNVFVLYGFTGAGKTTVLRETHHAVGGALLTMQDFVNAMHGQHPLALEEVFEQMVMDALRAHDCVIVDDLHLINDVVCCNGAYPRLRYLNTTLSVLSAFAVEAKKKIIFA